jgi:hypothetical protein
MIVFFIRALPSHSETPVKMCDTLLHVLQTHEEKNIVRWRDMVAESGNVVASLCAVCVAQLATAEVRVYGKGSLIS